MSLATESREDDAALLLALWEGARLVDIEPTEAWAIMAEIERLYAGADEADMRWLPDVRAGLEAICRAKGIEVPVAGYA